SSSKEKREPQVLSTKSNDNFDVVKGDLNTKVISKEFEGGLQSVLALIKTDVHDVEEIQMMDDDVLPIAHEILVELELVRDKMELSKSHNPSKPLTSIPVNKKKSPSKSPCIAEAFAVARNARKHKVILGIRGGARGDQNETLDAANGSKSDKEKDFVVVAGDTSALKKGFAYKVRIGKELVLVIQSLAIFPAVQSVEYADSRVVPQELSIGLGANDDTGGDALGKEGTTSGWTGWKDVRMPFPLGMQADLLMKDMPPLTRLSWKVLVLDMNGVLLRRYPYPDIPDQ
ncbi:hypothetical protein L7F22_057423, partial [Adiantum nelumboides]|nr:hypothetical protein [Adiantum nelumboides]